MNSPKSTFKTSATVLHNKPKRPDNSLSMTSEGLSPWKGYEKIIFRITFVYLILLCAPLAPDWYQYIYKINWSELNCRDLFIIATCRHPEYYTFASESGKWGLLSYVNLFIPLIVAAIIGSVWGVLDKERNEYNNLYYWIRVIVRYRVGVGIVAWGFRKLVPGQMVWPTTSILNTPFGDFQAQKLYWQAVGIVPSYEIFLGLAEFVAGFLLLFRKTTALGAALTAVVLGNIVIANHVYDGSVHVHSAYYTILALILLWKDLPDIWDLLVREKNVNPSHFYPVFSGWNNYLRQGLKLFVHSVFVILFFVLQIDDFKNTPYRLPDTPGVKALTGTYDVTKFHRNGKALSYDPQDSVRWQDVIFENWSTLTFRINKPSVMDQSNGGGYSKKDIERSWELAGIGGGRRYFYYVADTVGHLLTLQNKNLSHRKEKMVLHYSKKGNDLLLLEGKDEQNNKLKIELKRRNKVYPLLSDREIVKSLVSAPW